MKLNTKSIAGLKLPESKSDAIFWDSDLIGFGLRMRAAGDGRILRSWICQYRNAAGRTRRKLIGPAEVLTTEQARAAAKKILAEVALGGDPQSDKAARRQGEVHGLAAVIDDYLEMKQKTVRPRTYKEVVRYLRGGAFFKSLQTTPVDQVRRRDVASCLTKIVNNNGSTTAIRAKSALSAFYVWAVGNGLSETNPVIGTVLPEASRPRDRVLSDDELRAIWRALDDGTGFGTIIRLLILLAARRGEVGGMRWSELDLERGVWALPAARSKNGRAHSLPLPPLALSIIESVPRRADRDQLFGSRSSDGLTHWHAKAELDRRLAGRVQPWRLHDLRRSAATRMADLGVQPHIIEALLNHYSGHRAGVAGTYNRSPYEREVKAALALWADHVQALVDGTERKVVALRVTQ
jgi:integrase